jgi:phosphonate transport system substrate-binding protein
VAASACGNAGASNSRNEEGMPGTLRVGVVPSVSPADQEARYKPLQDYLADRLHTKVKLFVATDYAGVVTALVAKKLDVAYLGGLTYVQAKQQVDLDPLVTEVDKETGTREYLSGIVVRDDSPYKSVKDLLADKGKFAFGDVSSTSGSLYPRVMLDAAGAECSTTSVDSCPPLSKVTFTGGHDATAEAVLNGSVDAGGLEVRIMHQLERKGTIPKNRLKIIESHRVMGYPWVIRTALGDTAAQSVTAAFEAIKDPEILNLLNTTGYQKVTAADYADVEKHAKDLGLLTTGH